MQEHSFTLKDINVGFADGEKEAEESNFLDIFYNENNKYEQLLKKNNFIISGRKGTGKTILAKYYQKTNNKNNTIIEYSKLNEISLHEYIDIETSTVSKDDRLLFQNFYIYKQFLITIKDNKLKIHDFISKSNSFKDNLKFWYNYHKYKKIYNKIVKFYNDCYPEGPYHEIGIKNTQTITEASKGQVDANMGVTGSLVESSLKSELSKEVTMKKKNYIELLENFKPYILQILKYINVSIIIDDLDEIKMTSGEHAIDFLISLVTKVNDINIEIQKVNPKSKCILLLRSDIISGFSSRSSNIQKILTDSNIELLWFKDSSGDELSNMIMHKIQKSTNNNTFNSYSLNDIRKKIFRKIKGQNKRKHNDTFDMIVNFSFGRPRDVITYLNCIISKYQGNKNVINFTMVKDAEYDYSKKILAELRNEMSFKLDTNTIMDIENLLRNFRKSAFSYQEISTFFEANKNNYPLITNLDDILQYLYELGMLGNYREQSNKGKKYYGWSYRNGGEKLNKNDKIVVHLSVRKALNLVIE